MLVQKIDGAWREWRGERIDGVLYPTNIESLWSTEDLRRIGLFVPRAFVAPQGQVATGSPRIESDGEHPVLVYDTVTPPEARPEPLDGALFLARLENDEYQRIIAASSQSAQLARWIELLRMRGAIALDGDDAREAKSALVGAGLLTQERADAIFAVAG